MDEFTKPDKGGVATLEEPNVEAPEQPSDNIDLESAGVHPDDEPQQAVEQASPGTEGGTPSEEEAGPELRLAPLPDTVREEVQERGIDPLTPISELYGDEHIGWDREAEQQASKSAILGFVTANAALAQEGSKITPGRLLEEEFPLAEIGRLRTLNGTAVSSSVSPQAGAVIERDVLEALFEPQHDLLNPRAKHVRAPGVQDHLGIGNAASFASIDPDLAAVRDLAMGQMRPASGKEVAEFPSMGNSNSPDMTIGPERKVRRMAATVMPEFLESESSVVVASAREGIRPVLPSYRVREVWEGPDGDSYRESNASKRKAA